MIDDSLDLFDEGTFDHAARLLKDELSIALEEFFEDAEMYIQDIEKSLHAGDTNAAAKAAHPLKSNTRSFGLTSMADLAQHIHDLTRNADNNQDAITEGLRLSRMLRESFGIAKLKISERATLFVT